MQPLIVFLMGPTRVGKGTYLDSQRGKPGVAMVEVGKEFRRRYPPDHFKGQSNPEWTRAEALTIYREQMFSAFAEAPSLVYVDGQPRTTDQIGPVIECCGNYRLLFLLLTASAEASQKRAWDAHQFEPNSGNYDLRLRRIVNDRVDLYNVVTELLADNRVVKVIRTDRGTPSDVAEQIQSVLNSQ